MIYLENQPVDVTIFPDKTSQVWNVNEQCLASIKNFTNGAQCTVTWSFESEGEFLHLAQLKDLLDSEGISSILNIPTLPYARQDKEINNKETFALRTFAKLLNTLKFKRVYSKDVHNIKLTESLIDNFANIAADPSINMVFDRVKADMICFPDEGAKLRYNLKKESCYGIKKRCPETGYIEGYNFVGEVRGKIILICDDLVDGGMTFIKCTEKLLQGGAKEVYLYASHGIFSKGTNVLFDAGISRIFTKEGEINERS